MSILRDSWRWVPVEVAREDGLGVIAIAERAWVEAHADGQPILINFGGASILLDQWGRAALPWGGYRLRLAAQNPGGIR